MAIEVEALRRAGQAGRDYNVRVFVTPSGFTLSGWSENGSMMAQCRKVVTFEEAEAARFDVLSDTIRIIRAELDSRGPAVPVTDDGEVTPV
jgi:hypothetical protein